jgi:hypothetical protein
VRGKELKWRTASIIRLARPGSHRKGYSGVESAVEMIFGEEKVCREWEEQEK